MKIKNLLIFGGIFLIGFILGNFISLGANYSFEKPFSLEGGVTNYFSSAPSDHITNDQITVYPDKVVINIPGAAISTYASTGSMLPILDEDANGIRIKPQSEEDIKVGDIISFKKGDNLIVHRVIKKGTDEDGVYFITKGDNNRINDGKIRFDQIEYLTIGLIY